MEWFKSQNIRPKRMEELEKSIDLIENIIKDEEWQLNLRFVKWAVRFQVAGGRNAFYIGVRKTLNHILRIPLGADFNPDTIDLKNNIKQKLKHKKKSSRWWHIAMEIEEIQDYVPLLRVGYEMLVG